MTVWNFLRLKEVNQHRVIRSRGILSHRMKHLDCIYEIYKVDTFYLELCRSLNTRSARTMKIFDNKNEVNEHLKNTWKKEQIALL